jgi:hypothetical protein
MGAGSVVPTTLTEIWLVMQHQIEGVAVERADIERLAERASITRRGV